MKQFFWLLLVVNFVGCAQVKKMVPLEKTEFKKDFFSVKWSKNLDPIHNAGNLPIGTASPLIEEDILFIGSLSGVMNAYDLESGRIIWQENEKQPINSKATKFNDSIIYGSKLGRVFSRHYLTGKLNYAIDLGSSIESEPVIYSGRMFFHLRNHRIVSMDAKTGKIIWSYKRSVPYTTTLQRVSKVLPYDNHVIVGFADGYVGAISISEGVIVWEQKITSKHKFIDVDVVPVLFGENLVIGSANGDLSFLNPQNGILNRSYDFTLAAAPYKLKDTLYVGSIFGEIMSIASDGSIIEKKKVASDGITSITYWHGKVIASTMDGKILSLNADDLSIIDKYELGSDYSTVFGSLEQSSNYLAVYSSRNRLYLFQ